MCACEDGVVCRRCREIDDRALSVFDSEKDRDEEMEERRGITDITQEEWPA